MARNPVRRQKELIHIYGHRDHKKSHVAFFAQRVMVIRQRLCSTSAGRLHLFSNVNTEINACAWLEVADTKNCLHMNAANTLMHLS